MSNAVLLERLLFNGRPAPEGPAASQSRQAGREVRGHNCNAVRKHVALRSMKPKRRPTDSPRNVTVEAEALLWSIKDLLDQGGVNAKIRQAEKQAGDDEAKFWLGILEERLAQMPTWDDRGGAILTAIAQGWIKSLRKRLGIRPTPETIRVQTRERVRRHRQGPAAGQGLQGHRRQGAGAEDLPRLQAGQAAARPLIAFETCRPAAKRARQ